MASESEGIDHLAIVDEFVTAQHLRCYQEDLYRFEPERGVYLKLEDGAVRNLLLAEIEEALPADKVTAGRTNNLLTLVEDRTFLRGDVDPPFHIESMQPLRVIVCRNGVIHLDRGMTDGRWALEPHSPDIFALGAVDYAYDPTATCPKFDALLLHVCNGDPEVARMIIEFTASVFARHEIAFEAVLWLTGRGRDGKSTVFRTLRRVIGESVTSAVGLEAFTAGNTFRTWPLLHKVANFASDAVINDRSNFAALNAWVSRDPVTINRKFRESVTVVPKAVLFFASNAEPVANDPSDAFWRRLRLVKCLHQVDEKDVNPRLSEELFEEAPGILNKVLASLPVIERAKAIVMPEAVRQNVFELRTRVGSFREFASEELERGTEKDFVYRDDTISQYRSWALQKNLVVEDLRRIRSEMERLFGSRDRRRRVGKNKCRVYVWSGVRECDHFTPAGDDDEPINVEAAPATPGPVADDTGTFTGKSACHREPAEAVPSKPSVEEASGSSPVDDDDDEDIEELLRRIDDDTDDPGPGVGGGVLGGAA